MRLHFSLLAAALLGVWGGAYLGGMIGGIASGSLLGPPTFRGAGAVALGSFLGATLGGGGLTGLAMRMGFPQVFRSKRLLVHFGLVSLGLLLAWFIGLALSSLVDPVFCALFGGVVMALLGVRWLVAAG